MGIENKGGFRLNPFEFRAGLELIGKLKMANANEVLIPLNSGLAWSGSPRSSTNAYAQS